MLIHCATPAFLSGQASSIPRILIEASDDSAHVLRDGRKLPEVQSAARVHDEGSTYLPAESTSRALSKPEDIH